MMVLNFEAPCFVPNTKIVTRTDTYPESDVSVSTFLAVSPTILDIPSEVGACLVSFYVVCHLPVPYGCNFNC